jgi:hypothetical protein
MTRIEEIRATYLEGVLDLECAPEGAYVWIDDNLVRVAQTPARGLRLDAGTHRIILRMEGFQDRRLSVRITAGKSRTVQCSLEPAAGTPEASPSHVVSTSLFVVGAVALLAGIGAGIWAETTASRERSSVDPQAKPDLRDAARTRALLADLAFGSAVLFGGAGLVLRLTVERPRASVALGANGARVDVVW